MFKSQKYDINCKITNIDELLPNGKPFFRKMTYSEVEKEISRILMNNPHPNIVNIYNIVYDHIDIELVKPLYDDKKISINEKKIILSKMNEVKKHLQSLGIIYFDWKYDNIGIGEDGEYKLYDFDVCGIIPIDGSKDLWKIAPPSPAAYAYRKCMELFIISPIEMDNYSFNHFNLKF